jgi:hypothetical protein
MKKQRNMFFVLLVASVLSGFSVSKAQDMQGADDEVVSLQESDDTYIPVVTPVAQGSKGVLQGTGRAAKGTVHGTGEVLTGHPVEGTKEIVTETVEGAGEAVKSAVMTPFNILSGK